jgi:peroxiredoxin
MQKLSVKPLFFVFLLLVLLTGCSGGQAMAPSLLEGTTGISSALRPNQEIPKSASALEVASSEGNLSPVEGNGEETLNDPGIAPEKSNPEANDSAAAFVVPAVLPTPVPTEQVVELPPPPPVDLSIPVGPKIGLRAPDFSLQSLDGSTVALSDLIGQPLVINYWATWCVPCKKELPILEKLFQEYRSRGLLIVSVDAIEQDTADKLQSVIAESGITYPTLLDEGNQFSDAYQAIFFPTSFFIDASGVIRDVTLGDSSEEIFRQKIEALLSGEF